MIQNALSYYTLTEIRWINPFLTSTWRRRKMIQTMLQPRSAPRRDQPGSVNHSLAATCINPENDTSRTENLHLVTGDLKSQISNLKFPLTSPPPVESPAPAAVQPNPARLD